MVETGSGHDGGWLEIRVAADAESVDAVAELFSRYVYNQGVVIQEPFRQDRDGDNLVIDVTRPVTVLGYLPFDEALEERLVRVREGLWHLGRLGEVGNLETAERPEEDWANAWREHFQVTRIGRRFVVRPTWRDYTPLPGDVVIDLDPGMAFGTGLHPTTELCLRWLEKLPLDGRRILDAGAGSGILTIAAAKLGARAIDAVEIDPVAVKALRENIALNGLEDRVAVWCGDVTRWLPSTEPYDLVVANILSRILVDAADNLNGAVRTGGALILSGVIEAHEPDVVAAYEARGLALSDRVAGGDWVSLLFTKHT